MQIGVPAGASIPEWTVIGIGGSQRAALGGVYLEVWKHRMTGVQSSLAPGYRPS